ncbi:MAG: hypothetical protein HQ568_01270 [Calditrichaeota bacterium]|nr:hypothetical protein [Calditrichota bacterium]
MVTVEGIEVKLWIIRWQYFLAKLLRSNIIASILMFYAPIMVSGCILQVKFDFIVITRGVFIALLWIAISPYIIKTAFNQIIYFFNRHKHIFQNHDEWKNTFFNELQRVQSSKYLLFGIPWGIITSIIITYTAFQKAPMPIQLWSFLSFFLLFFVSSIGFYGVYVLITMMNNIFNVKIIFNPYHPDRFGGISSLGRFTVKIGIYFSSGALVFPLAYEIIDNLKELSLLLHIATILVTILFGLVMFICFLVPIFQIKRFVDPEKERIILESRVKLDRMMEEFNINEELDFKKALETLGYYYFSHSKLLEIKDYPFDFRIFLEFGLSFIIPVGIAIIEVFFR